MEEQNDNWKPLESNPEVMNNFLKGLGFNTGLYAVQDLLSIQQWAQEMLPKPIFGLVFLYSINEIQKEYKKEEAKTLDPNAKFPQKLFYMKQQARNACGTIALFHVILNASHSYPDVYFKPSFFDEFQQKGKGKNPQELAELFRLNKDVKQKHKQSVDKGQSSVQDDVETHFIAFISAQDTLYELDGCKKCPVNHGPCKPDQLVTKGCQAIQKFMLRDPQNLNFTILAIGAKPQ